MKTIFTAASEEGISLAAELLKKGDICAIPTETVYGIAADARNQNAVEQIFVAKGRPQDNPLIVHVSGLEMLDGLVSEVPERALLLAHAFWPGALTMVLPRGGEVAAACCAGLNSVGVRAPSHPVARAIIQQSGCAFAAPSANRSGSPSPTTAGDVLADMDGRLPLILDGGDCEVGVESTVISLLGKTPVLLRPGVVTLAQMELVLGERIEVSGAILEALQEGEEARSPGMKYKHYAPNAQVTILEGDFAAYAGYLKAHESENPICLCFEDDVTALEELGFSCVCYGKEGDGVSQAKHLFRALRALDEAAEQTNGASPTVYARCPQKDGVSMAVYNRLVRAAAFRVIAL